MIQTAERIRALLALYRESDYDVRMPRGGMETLKVGRSPSAAIARWIGRDRFGAFLTACNPRSQPLPSDENERRLDALRDALRTSRGRFLEGTGHMPGERWREPSLFVAGLGIGDVDALMSRFDQNCIVVVHRAKPAVLRIYRSEWRGVAAEAGDLEWAAAP